MVTAHADGSRLQADFFFSCIFSVYINLSHNVLLPDGEIKSHAKLASTRMFIPLVYTFIPWMTTS